MPKPNKEPQAVYVGVDPSLTNTGVVVLGSAGQVLAVGNAKEALKDWHKLKKEIRKGPAAQIFRLSLIEEYVSEVIEEALATYDSETLINVGYEDYSFDSLNRPYALGELGGALKSALLKRVTGITLVPPTLLKQFSTGHGQADKNTVIAQAKLENKDLKALGKKHCTDDVCDAYFLAKFAWYKKSPELVVKYETCKDNLRSRLEIAKGGF